MTNVKFPVSLADFTAQDEPGNSTVVAFAFDADKQHCATLFSCDKAGCNCQGHWSSGDLDDAVFTVFREDVV